MQPTHHCWVAGVSMAPFIELPAPNCWKNVEPSAAALRGKPEDRLLLANCYLNSLKLAVENSISTIAFPAISCGVYGYPIEDACKIAVDTSCGFIKANPSVEKIIFIQFSTDDYAVYEAYLKSLT
jgi:O-acetyl-ADP-ribose deacetylase (regulator of RNase III)